MITSRTIQHNSNRTYDISFILLSHNEENDQKVGFRDLKCRNGAQNWNLREKLSKIGPVEKFWLWSKSTVNGQQSKSTVNSQSQRSTDDVCWRGSVTSPRLTWQDAKHSRRVESVGRVGEHGTGAWGAWRILTMRGDAWSACSWGRNFHRRVEARVMQFLVVLGWVLLGIGCSVFLCLFFGSWMSKTLIFESCRYCGHDGGGSLLIVTTGWRREQRKNVGDVHRSQKVRGMTLILC